MNLTTLLISREWSGIERLLNEIISFVARGEEQSKLYGFDNEASDCRILHMESNEGCVMEEQDRIAYHDAENATLGRFPASMSVK